MKKIVFAILGVSLLLVSSAWAQTPVYKPAKSVDHSEQTIQLSGSVVEPTSEMWFYQQERKDRLDTKLAIRRREMLKGIQRRQRIAAMRWFGFSNQRPTVSPDPINGYYSPFWAGNNPLSPYMWSGCGYTTVVVRPNATTSR
jgi:hypothetical protein